MVEFANGQGALRTTIAAFAIVWTALIVAMAGLVVFYLYIDIRPPITYGAVTTADRTGRASSVFRAGETMAVTRAFCSRPILVDIDRRLVSVDGKVSFAVGASSSILPDGCRSGDTREVVLPSVVPPGKYQYIITVSWSNNLLHAGTMQAPAPTIEIVP